MEAVIPWVKLLAVIEPFYLQGQRGRPPIGLARRLRVYFLQQWPGLADAALADALSDSQALQGFARIELAAEGVPDATTPLKFRRLLETHDLGPGRFPAINADLDWPIARKRGAIKALAEGAEKETRKAVEQGKAAGRAFGEPPFPILKNRSGQRADRCAAGEGVKKPRPPPTA